MSDYRSHNRPGTDPQANNIYDILVAACGATEGSGPRRRFSAFVEEHRYCYGEYPFVGHLGPGSVFVVSEGAWLVKAEADRGPDIRLRIERTNLLLSITRDAALASSGSDNGTQEEACTSIAESSEQA